MKNKIFITLLLCAAITTQAQSQVKKPLAKPVAKKTASTAAKSPFSKIDFFSKDADDVAELLSNQFKKLKVSLKDMDERPVVMFNMTTHEKLPDNTTTEKTMEFTTDLTVYIQSWDDNIVSKLTFATKNDKQYAAIKEMLGVNKMMELTSGDSDTTLRAGNIFVSVSSESSYDDDDKPLTAYTVTAEYVQDINMKIPASTERFNPRGLDLHQDPNEIREEAINYVRQLGYTYYYLSFPYHHVTDDGKFDGYNLTAVFNRQVSVTFYVNKLWMLNSISFSSDDPIAFSKLKRAFDLSGWKKNNKAKGDVSKYNLNNVECTIDGEYHFIEFNISPDPKDDDTRLALAETVTSIAELMALRDLGTEEEIQEEIDKRFLSRVVYDETSKKYVPSEKAEPLNFYFMSPGGKVVVVYLKLQYTSTVTTPFLLNTLDAAYMQALSDEFDKTPEYKNNYEKYIKDGKFRMYDNKMEAKIAADKAEQKRAEEERAAAQRERERLAEAERQRLQAEKDARFNENLRKTSEILEKLLKKN